MFLLYLLIIKIQLEIMKKIYVTFLLISLSLLMSTYAQDGGSCYEQYRKVFENRGANPVEDGAHDNIILTVRTGDASECYVARAVVQESQIVEIDLYFEDGSFEKKEYEFKDKSSWSIHNGMSKTKITEKDEYINIMFVNKIKPKRKKLMKAPKPVFDLN